MIFEATDQCGASSRAHLLIHILQPPRVAKETEVWVERGGSTTFTLAVIDPDSSEHSISFKDLPDGIAIKQIGEYDGYFDSDWDTHYYTFEISAEKGRVCPGDYEVPYVVTDSDENRAEGVLIIHVVGNRPPEGEANGSCVVRLGGGGRERLVPIAMTSVYDPDGDPIFFEGFTKPPEYGSLEGIVVSGESLMGTYRVTASQETLCQACLEGGESSTEVV